MTSELTSVKAIHNHRNIAVDPLMARIMIYSFNLVDLFLDIIRDFD